MAIRIELTPEEEGRLRQQAERRGEQLETFAGELLRALLPSSGSGSPSKLAPVVNEAGLFDPERWDRVLASIREGSALAPALPREALTREALYSDHA